MAKKYMKIEQCEAGHYIVFGVGKVVLGTIEKPPKSRRWKFFPDTSVLDEVQTWFTWECLDQLSAFLKELESA